MKNTEVVYREYLESNKQMSALRSLILAIQNNPENVSEPVLEEFKSICRKIDIKLFNKLLDEGRVRRDINEAFLNYNIFSEFIKDKSKVKEYETAVYMDIDNKRQTIIDRDYKNAVNNYKELKKAYQYKYSSNNEAYQDYYEGKIIIDMLQHDFSIDTIEKVLQQEIPDEKKEKSAYIKKLLEECSKVRLIYQDIQQSPPIDHATNEVEAYQAAAKRFMKYYKLKVMGFEEERNLVKIMLEDNFPREYVENALLRGSPIAAEPGRNPQEYVRSVLADLANNVGITQDAGIEQQIKITAGDVYKDFLENKKTQLDKQAIDYRDNRRYYDCLAAKDLIEKDFTEDEIIKAVSENNPNAPADEQYVGWIYQVAQRLITAEQEMLKFFNTDMLEINKNLSLEQLTDSGITPLNIFYSIVKEHYELNPSIANHLYEPRIDLDSVETMKLRYPEIDRDTLSGIIAKSPRGVLLLGIQSAYGKNHYPESVITKVEEIIDKSTFRNKIVEKNKKEFQTEHDIIRQGLNTQDISEYSLGRTALKMLLKGHNEVTIKSTIIDLYDNPEDVKADVIDSIMVKSNEVYRRLIELKNAAVIENPQSPRDYYINRFQLEYQKKHTLKSSIDVIIAKELLARNYPNNIIEETIKTLSPISIEPGRNNDYLTKYVMTSAKVQYHSEKSKLVEYNMQPHQEIKSPEKEYKKFNAQLHTDIDLPHEMLMDRKIAAVMLLEGIAAEEIAETIQMNSPVDNKPAEYAVSILNSLDQLTINDYSEANSNTMQRMRIYNNKYDEGDN